MTKAYVINLKNRKDRWEKIQEQFKGVHCITLERVDAIDANYKTNEDFQNYPPYIYCGLSHQKILREHKDEGNILILEDDCGVTDKDYFSNKWPCIKEWLDDHPDDWDMFNGSPTNIEDYNIESVVCDNLQLVELNEGMTTHFTYYNNKFIDTVLDEWKEENFIKFDMFSFWAKNEKNEHKIKIITSIPYIVYQYNSYSDVESDEHDYTPLFIVSENILKKGYMDRMGTDYELPENYT